MLRKETCVCRLHCRCCPITLKKSFYREASGIRDVWGEFAKYRIFLLSNTNSLHISWIQKTWGAELYSEFKKCFEKFYLSHEIHLRKPNQDIYKFVLNTNRLVPEETFFIDDTEENTITASTLGIKVWNINPACEDVVDLFSQKEFN